MDSSSPINMSAKIYRTHVIPLLFKSFSCSIWLGTLLSGSNFLQICDIDPQHWSFLCLWWNVKLITPCRKILHSIDQVGSFNWVWSIAKGVMDDEYGRIDDSHVVKFWAQMSALNFKLSIKYVWKLCQTDRNRHARKVYWHRRAVRLAD